MTPTELNAEIDAKYPFLDLPERIKRAIYPNISTYINIFDSVSWDNDSIFWKRIHFLEYNGILNEENVRAIYVNCGIPLPEEKEKPVRPTIEVSLDSKNWFEVSIDPSAPDEVFDKLIDSLRSTSRFPYYTVS